LSLYRSAACTFPYLGERMNQAHMRHPPTDFVDQYKQTVI
jgi:hypothetical protein